MPDERVKKVPIGCGRCIECRRQKKREWQIRLNEELKREKHAKFVTLTFNEESLSQFIQEHEGKEVYNQICTRAVRLFLERWRKKTKTSVKHWLITELGHTGTERIHMHGVIFTDKSADFITETWGYGFVWVGKFVNEKTINYITKYVLKEDKDHKDYLPKILCSKGIGSNYTETGDYKRNQYQDTETDETYRLRNGMKLALPIYYRNKIYSEEEREKLWLNKLDKQERWVDGVRIDISTKEGLQAYQRVLETAQKKNERMNYGGGEENFEKSIYSKTLEDLNGITARKKAERKQKKKQRHFEIIKKGLYLQAQTNKNKPL